MVQYPFHVEAFEAHQYKQWAKYPESWVNLMLLKFITIFFVKYNMFWTSEGPDKAHWI